MFQYNAKFALNYRKIKYNPETVSHIEPFINRYNWDRIKYPPKKVDGKKLKSNNPTITLNIQFQKEMEIYPAYISKYNSTLEKKVIFLRLASVEKGHWHYLLLKNIFIITWHNLKR